MEPQQSEYMFVLTAFAQADLTTGQGPTPPWVKLQAAIQWALQRIHELTPADTVGTVASVGGTRPPISHR